MAKQNDKKEKAKSLFLTGQYSQKEISSITGISEKTISKWKDEDDWESFKTSLLTTRENELKRLYKILKSVNDTTIEDIDAGRKVNSKDAGAVIKYTEAIKNLEIETSIADKVEVGIAFINFVRTGNVELSKEIAGWFDTFLKQFIK